MENTNIATSVQGFWQQIASSLGIETAYDWMIEVTLIMLVTAVLSLMAGQVLRMVSHLMRHTDTQWDDIFVQSARLPLKLIIWVMGTYFAAAVAFGGQGEETIGPLANLCDVAIVLSLAWGVLRYIHAGTNHYIEQRTVHGQPCDYTSVQVVAKLLKISVLISAALISLQSLGISVSGVLAFGGIGGIAVGFAAKDMLANFFGAMIIYFDKPFKVGDWIRSPDQDIEGTVEDIGWRMTTIRTFDKRPLYVPNAVFTTISVENPSRMSHRRIYETVGIRYDDIAQMGLIVEAVKHMLVEHHDIDHRQTLIVNFDAFNASSCDFFIYTFTHTTDWIRYHAIKQDVLLKVAGIVSDYQAEMAFPTQTVHLATGSEKLVQ